VHGILTFDDNYWFSGQVSKTCFSLLTDEGQTLDDWNIFVIRIFTFNSFSTEIIIEILRLHIKSIKISKCPQATGSDQTIFLLVL